MEKKVKINLPGKYRVGIQVVIPMVTEQFRDACRSVFNVIADIMGDSTTSNFKDSFDSEGKAVVSVPMIHSIAETKMGGLNTFFDQSGMPFKAYLEKEEP